MGVAQQALEVVLSDLALDERWDVLQVEVTSLGASDLLGDREGQQAVDVHVGAAGQVESKPGAWPGWVGAAGPADCVADCLAEPAGGRTSDRPDDADVGGALGYRIDADNDCEFTHGSSLGSVFLPGMGSGFSALRVENVLDPPTPQDLGPGVQFADEPEANARRFELRLKQGVHYKLQPVRGARPCSACPLAEDGAAGCWPATRPNGWSVGMREVTSVDAGDTSCVRRRHRSMTVFAPACSGATETGRGRPTNYGSDSWCTSASQRTFIGDAVGTRLGR